MFKDLDAERKTLKEDLAMVQQVGEIRSDELRELGKEFDLVQGQAYTARRELEQTKKSELSLASTSQEQKRVIHQLEGRLHDLQTALDLAAEAQASKKSKPEQTFQSLTSTLTPE